MGEGFCQLYFYTKLLIQNKNRRGRNGMYAPMPTAKAIFLLWGVFENVQSKLKNVHKCMNGINKMCCGKMGLEKNKCMILNKEDIVKFHPYKTSFNL